MPAACQHEHGRTCTAPQHSVGQPEVFATPLYPPPGRTSRVKLSQPRLPLFSMATLTTAAAICRQQLGARLSCCGDARSRVQGPSRVCWQGHRRLVKCCRACTALPQLQWCAAGVQQQSVARCCCTGGKQHACPVTCPDGSAGHNSAQALTMMRHTQSRSAEGDAKSANELSNSQGNVQASGCMLCATCTAGTARQGDRGRAGGAPGTLTAPGNLLPLRGLLGLDLVVAVLPQQLLRLSE
jgi:hypothetical protein